MPIATEVSVEDEVNEVQEIVEIPEEAEVAPEPVAVDTTRPLRRKKT